MNFDNINNERYIERMFKMNDINMNTLNYEEAWAIVANLTTWDECLRNYDVVPCDYLMDDIQTRLIENTDLFNLDTLIDNYNKVRDELHNIPASDNLVYIKVNTISEIIDIKQLTTRDIIFLANDIVVDVTDFTSLKDYLQSKHSSVMNLEGLAKVAQYFDFEFTPENVVEALRVYDKDIEYHITDDTFDLYLPNIDFEWALEKINGGWYGERDNPDTEEGCSINALYFEILDTIKCRKWYDEHVDL